jgi:hypothetical protein
MAEVASVKAATMPMKVMTRPMATMMLAHHSRVRAGVSARSKASEAWIEAARRPSSVGVSWLR